MKYSTIIFCVMSFWGIVNVSGQTPGFINYQAAIRKADGKPIENEIVNGSYKFLVGDQQFEKPLVGLTDDFGVLNLQIGGEELKQLNWSEGNARLIVNYVEPLSFNDTLLITAVPYALFAESSGSSLPGPPPSHEWDGTRIRFENPDGTFGEFKDLQGPQGNSVRVLGSVPTENDLPSGQQNQPGDLYFIEISGDGYVWNGEKWINLGRIQGPKGDRGQRGEKGEKGERPNYIWNGTSLSFERPDGTFGPFVNLKGDQGNTGQQGLAAEHQWMTSRLRFRNPDGSWGDWIELKGEKGDVGQAPEHQWNEAELRFRNPDGSWGSYSNLMGPAGPEGDKGDKPQHQWNGASVRFENPDGTFGPFVNLQGPQGNSVTVVGSVPTVNDLPNGANNNTGDMIIVADTGEGYVWTGEMWINVGQVQGPPGQQGPIGPSPDHQWNQTALRFRNPDGTWGPFTNLKGDTGDQGSTGLAPDHQWNQTGLRFRNPDGTWGPFTDLQGPEGEMGLAPEHQWIQTGLRFRNPDGTWGQITNLKGEQGDTGSPGLQGIQGPQGEQGLQGETGLAPEHQWVQTALRFRNPDGTWGGFTNLKGEQGDQGPPNSLNIGTVQSGTNAQAQITGQAPNQTLNLILPQGAPGQDGSPGPPNSLSIGTVQSGPNAAAQITGQAPNQTLNLIIPQGPQGIQGPQGPQGPQGEPGPPGASSANGDVTGPLNNTQVEKIRGVNIAPTAPTEGQLLVFLNGAWRPAQLPGLNGDVGGTISNTTVQGLRNKPVANENPQNGDVLTYQDGAWRPSASTTSGGSGVVFAGAVNQFGSQSFVSDPSISVTVEGSTVIVSIAGVNLNGNNCSAVAIGRNNLNLYFRVTFVNGSARFTVNENGADPYPMNFMIYR